MPTCKSILACKSVLAGRPLGPGTWTLRLSGTAGNPNRNRYVAEDEEAKGDG
jgi:hypothetical protein